MKFSLTKTLLLGGMAMGAVFTTPVNAIADTTIRIAGTHAPDQYASVVLKRIKKTLEEGGVGLKVKVFPAGQLGSGEQLIGDAIRGSIDIVHAFVYSHKDPVLDIASLPYMFTNYEQMKTAYQPGSVYYDTIANSMDKMGLKLLGVTGEGFIGVMGSKKPENYTTTDHKGMNIRVWSSPAAQSATKALGYNTTTIDWGDAFAALQQKTVDGMIGATAEATYTTFKEAVSYYVPYNAFVESTNYYASKKTWEKKLNQEQRDLIEATFAKEALGFVEWSKGNDQKYLDKLKQDGVEILPISQEEVSKIAGKIREVTWPVMEERLGKELLTKLKDSLK